MCLSISFGKHNILYLLFYNSFVFFLHLDFDLTGTQPEGNHPKGRVSLLLKLFSFIVKKTKNEKKGFLYPQKFSEKKL